MLAVLAFQVVLISSAALLLTKSGQNIDLTLILSITGIYLLYRRHFFDGLRVGEMISSD